MYICVDCGNKIEENEAFILRRSIDPNYPDEHELRKCECGGNIFEAKKCKICNKYIPEDEYDICNECLEENETLTNALYIGDEYAEDVPLNNFWTTVFTRSEIESVLRKEFLSYKKQTQDKLIKEYLREDTLYFSDWLVRNECEK